MAEEGGPHGVVIVEVGREARGWKGGEGRAERPVPPMMARGTGSGGLLVGCGIGRRGGRGCLSRWLGGWTFLF